MTIRFFFPLKHLTMRDHRFSFPLKALTMCDHRFSFAGKPSTIRDHPFFFPLKALTMRDNCWTWFFGDDLALSFNPPRRCIEKKTGEEVS